jgi:microcystin degradation protein MlrC
VDERFTSLVRKLGEEIWRTRERITIDFVSMNEAVDRALEPSARPGPFLIGDFSDTPHGGGYGDVPALLEVLIRRGVSNAAFGPIWDSRVVADALVAGPGAELDIALGGHSDPSHGGGPLVTRATVRAVSETGEFEHKGPFNHRQPGRPGPSAWLEVQGVDIIVVSSPQAIYDREQFRIFGIEPEQKNVIVVKAYNHFRADFEPIGRGLIYADSGGIFSFDFMRFDYHRVRRPIWPLDELQAHGKHTLVSRTAARLKR